jgi:hypothetical protein
MKKVLFLSSLVSMAAVGAFAQGTLNANNSGSGVLVQVQDPLINGGAATTIGTPATTAGFSGAGKGQVTIEMFAAVNGTSLQTLEASTPIWTGLNSPSSLGPAQGTFAPGNPFTLPSVAGVFDGSKAIEIIFWGVTSDGLHAGWSAEATGITPATGAGTPPAIFGNGAGLINSFVLQPVPEPSTIALGGLGAASLLLFRRRK